MQRKQSRLLSHAIFKKKKNSKWIKDLNARPETIKLLEKTLDISLSNIFLEMSLQVRETEAEINTWDYIILKSFYIVKSSPN